MLREFFVIAAVEVGDGVGLRASALPITLRAA
jgi:hypothetical protein